MVLGECKKLGIPENLFEDVHAIALKAASIVLDRLKGGIGL